MSGVGAAPVSWARRRALDAVMAWVREREKRGTPCGPEREYVNGRTGVTEITGAGKVYATEAVDRMERLLVDMGVPEMLALLRHLAEWRVNPYMFPERAEDEMRRFRQGAEALVTRIETGAPRTADEIDVAAARAALAEPGLRLWEDVKAEALGDTPAPIPQERKDRP